jgi:hypothetical protein
MGGKKQDHGTFNAPEPTFPALFDRSLLESDEYKRFIYSIPFKNKKTGELKSSKGITAAGLIRAAHPYLKSIESELLHYNAPEGRKILSCVVKVTVTLELPSKQEIKVSALADGDVTGVPSADTLVRTTETRALNRALERILDVSKADLNPEADSPDEEEHGTPMSLAEKLKAQRDKLNATAEEEEDADQTDTGRDVGESEPETSKDDDW